MNRTLVVQQTDGKPGQVYYPIVLKDAPMKKPGDGQLLVRIYAAGLNHRDLFVRQHLYPAISFDHPLLADGYGVVVETGPSCKRTDLLHKPVILTPMRNWTSDPAGPEDPRRFSIVGSSKLTEAGCAQDLIVVDEAEVEPAPEHLSPSEAAALPLVGLTGWRALFTKSGNALPGHNVLITGIGGGVALQVLQFAVAAGCHVFVTSGDQAKIDKAKNLGAQAGVIYKSDSWHKDLQALLPKQRPYIDTVIDGAGGDIIARTSRLLKPGGTIVQYGMTVSPQMTWSMAAVLANIELKGSTMGSRAEFRDMVAFVAKHKIRPVVSRAVRGLANIDGINSLFDDMKAGKQFGKLVIEIDDGPSDLQQSSPYKL